MLFNSFQYLLFLPLVLVAFHLLPQKYRWVMLLGASCWFYMAFVPVYILILAFTILVDYFSGLLIERSEGRRRKGWLIASIAANLGVLAVFKYYNFFNYNIGELFRDLGVGYHVPDLGMLLPIGLSFHTFQSLSYTIEVYRKREPAEKHLGIFALYVMYFPQLVAGPIERAGRLIPQLRNTPSLEPEDVRYAINKILLGYFKKVVVADNLAVFVDQLFGHVPSGTGLQYYIVAFMFSVQIFCDFSGYTDIALGSARLMGIRLMENFDRPVWSSNLGEFWSKWHISLTSWVRDYVFKPWAVGKPRWAAGLITIAVFVLIGFWHGASWNFLIFGLLNGVFVVGQDRFAAIKWLKPFNKSRPGKVLWSLWTLHLVVFFSIFFRAADVHDAFAIIEHILTDFRISAAELQSGFFAEMAMGFVLIGLTMCTALFNRQLRFKYNWMYVVGMLVLIFLLGTDAQNQFIYFQF
ncbi:MAG: MBOAT family O-acyltransferase [Flavobacteriales bacterium]